ncbi:hypothetical protein EDB83DRAFT_2547862 [Lactarius deliciosus]|nr:hypothetical protein EDB83DRAFT_2547862 [Lactarius deliciosus]
MGKRRHPRLSPGPPTKTQRIVTPDTEAMTSDVSTGRDFPNNALSDIAKILQKKLAKKNWKDDGTDPSFDSILSDIHVTITGTKDRIDGCPESFLDSLDQFIANVNVAKKTDPGFVGSLRQAVNGNNGELWGPILTHDVFYTVISDDSGHVSDFAKLQEEAVMRSWWTPFSGEHVLEALTDTLLRKEEKGIIHAILLNCSVIWDGEVTPHRRIFQNKLPDPYQPSPDFLLLTMPSATSSPNRAASVITNDLKEASSRCERISRFREFMTDGQTMASVGGKRRNFYKEIVDDVEIEMNQNGESTVAIGDVGRALQTLLSCLDGDNDAQIGRKRKKANDKFPGVFIAFDEAHSLAQPIESNDNNRTFFVELRSALQALLDTSSFVFFLSTTSKIPQFAMPGETDPSSRMHDKILRLPLPFSDLSFDHLMRDRKIFGAFKTISDVTSTDCVAHMGRPLWGAIYDSSLNRETLLDFAVIKLLCGRDDRSGDLSLSTNQQCAVLSQRLALDINSSAYITSGSTRNYVMADKVELQIADYMRVCIDSYAISHGDWGELLVAAFFTGYHLKKLFPNVLTQICPIFSVKDLLSELFQEAHFSTMLDSLPSICRADFSSQKFGDDVLTRSCLLAMMARGAAAFGANGQFGFDMVYPFLYGTSDLDVKKVGFIIIQVKNYANHLAPDPMLFKKMDPFLCDLLRKEDTDFAVPIIRIVFALGGGESSFTQQTYESPDDGAVTFDGHRQPQFTSYDFWCSGIGPNLLRPVDEDHAPKKWENIVE